jgi:cyclopropane-fatty-acyl-phospholipid synthase
MWLMDKRLRRLIRTGHLTVTTASGRVYRYGEAHPGRPSVAVRLTDRRVPFDILYDPALGAGEAYMNERLILERGDIMDLVDLFQGDARWEESGSTVSTAARWVNAIRARAARLNWQRRSKRNVAHHYDLSDRLYDLFLDADRQYSCAYFVDPANDLDEAQADKKAHIAAKLCLKPGQSVLDIGCGWGGMAFYLHRVADVDVLGITLSEEQLSVARRRAEELGVADRVKFELWDYRTVQGTYDRIVSVGMFEHVGPRHYVTFFRKCRDLLAEDGVLLLHTIGRMGTPGVTDTWTNKYIFPGAYNPALSEIVSASERTKMIVADMETLRLHYAHTLKLWYSRASQQRAEIESLYDPRFFRMWQFYLAGAWVAFRYGGLANYQIQFIRNRDALPITRNYISDAEDRLRPGHFSEHDFHANPKTGP